MKPHIHTDVISLTIGALATLTVAHLLRWGGAYIAGKGMVGPGTALGSFASLN